MWYSKKIEEIENKLKTNIKEGLTSKEAEKRIKINGKNELSKIKNKKWYFIFIKTLFEPLTLILLISAIIIIILENIFKKNISFFELIVLFIIIIINSLIQTIEQIKIKKSLNSLNKFTIPEVIVKRDNKIIKIFTNELVIGDIIFLYAGNYVPADIRIFESSNLYINESLITGESKLIFKNNKLITNNNNKKIILSDQKNMIFMSTLINNGKAIGIVVATGNNTEIGKINLSISNKNNFYKKTILQKKINNLTKVISILSLFISFLIFIIFYFINKNNWISNIMISITIAIAIIPESLTVIISIILSLSAKKMSKINVIIKKIDVIETLGSINIICSDKTGTLTQNIMSVKKIFINNNIYELNSFNSVFIKNNKFFFHFFNCLILCNDSINFNNENIGDPTEIALINFSSNYINFKNIKNNFIEKYKRIDEISFDSERKIMSTLNIIHNKKHNIKDYFIYTKGSIEKILKICNKIYLNNKIINFSLKLKEKIYYESIKLSKNSFRIISFAFKKYNNIFIEQELVFLGFVAITDPIRPEAIESIKKSYTAGIRVIMITGDHPETALSVAKNLKININKKFKDKILTGFDIENLSDEKLQKKLLFINIFARVNPEHKTRIVDNLQKLNYIVAMTGDGINDAPSLSKADVGISMGKTGTDISKEVSSIILKDDNFSTIINGIEEGRNVYQKIKKAIIFVISSNISQVLVFLFILIFTGIKTFNSINILWFNLIIETLLVIPISFDKNDKLLMFEKPKIKNNSFFKNNLITMFYIIFVTSFCVILTFFIILYFFKNTNILVAKFSTILVMSCCPAFYINLIKLSNYKILKFKKIKKSKKEKILEINWYLFFCIILTIFLNFLILFIPFLRNIFLFNNFNNNNKKFFININILFFIIFMIFLPSIFIYLYNKIRFLFKK